jgi:peptide/nickel transport system substrate-binding protein
MKSKLIVGCLGSLIAVSLLLASCASTTATTTTMTASATTSTNITTTTSTTMPLSTTPTSSTAVTVAATTTSTGNWWGSLGAPQYGSTLTYRIPSDITSFDPYLGDSTINENNYWMEQLNVDDWTVNPSAYTFQVGFRPSQYIGGGVEQSWVLSDPQTYVVVLRQGIYYQNLPPVNGREFTSADVVYHWDRELGLGDGFTKPSPYLPAVWAGLASVTATDNWTVVFKWTNTNAFEIAATTQTWDVECDYEASEVVQQYGNLNNWHNAVGTGPFILTDFVDNSSMTLVKNPNYWGYDERYPQNKIPYINQVNILIIPSFPTALAAMRAGKIDVCPSGTVQNAQAMAQTNPDIKQIPIPGTFAVTVDPRDDMAPFNNLNVRTAMQEAIDLPTLASTYYNGTTQPWPSTLASNYMGWGFPYNQWSASLQAEYAYNPTNAKVLLAAAGYPNGFNTNIVVDSSNDMDLLQIVQSYFAAVGINMTITPMPTAALTPYLTTAHANTALAQRASGCLGQNYDPIRMLRLFQTGYAANYHGVEDPNFDAFYTQANAATTVPAIQQIFSDANKYVAQNHFAISLLVPNTISMSQPWVGGYNSQDSFTSETPTPGGFYSARFWINGSLK